MTTPLHDLIVSRIRQEGPLTAAQYLDLALYHPQWGYYASADRRSGRDGDFFTSVDTGPLFGETLAVQIAEMCERLAASGVARFDLVEVAAGNGRLTRDILDALRRESPDLYAAVGVTLVERSGTARRAHPDMLAAHAPRILDSLADLPPRVCGIVLANELLDALPVHVVTAVDEELREIYVVESHGVLAERAGPLSTDRIREYFERTGAPLAPGLRAEVGLEAEQWVERAGASLSAGYLLLFDYGHEARELYSPAHAAGTLMTFHAHTADAKGWLEDPGACDLTAHVNLTAVRNAARRSGLSPAGVLDQSYFLMNLGIVERLPTGPDAASIARRLAAKTLLAPGGLGSTMKAMAFAAQADAHPLRGFRSGRLT